MQIIQEHNLRRRDTGVSLPNFVWGEGRLNTSQQHVLDNNLIGSIFDKLYLCGIWNRLLVLMSKQK